MKQSYLWNCVVNMTLASYIHPQPKANTQVKRMAKSYMRRAPAEDKLARRTLRNVVKTGQPALLVQIAYDELTGGDDVGVSQD